ncbi:MAG: transposase [Clostridia bacterium]|jgi:REP element-mobilizing transposase RayT|nr:transposase [Clostridia bacterium]
MTRQARIKGEFSIYHIMQRGNERRNLFLSDDDRVRFIETLGRMKKKYHFLLHAFCLMDNHVHLLIGDNGNDISKIVTSINISYAYYFNRTYQRCGHLFQDRFRSELVDNDGYLLGVSRYIHNNPVKAGIVTELSKYRWSSYNIYSGIENDIYGLIDKGRILNSFSSNRVKAAKEYIDYVNTKEGKHINFMDVEELVPIEGHNKNFISSMEQARLKIREAAENKQIKYEEIINQIEIRNDLIRQIRKNSSLTLKQIGEILGGISESRVSRILAKD